MYRRITITAVAVAGLVLSGATATAKDVKTPVVETGEIAGAAFRIDIPEDWNGGLVMYAHGYALAGSTPPFSVEYAKMAGKLGYAVAQSRYSRQGWAAREGILDTEALRRYFVDTYGETYPTIIAGHSQGGVITFATIERYPEVYDGALPMCTAGDAALAFFKQRVFDMRVLFDYFFPGLPGSAVDFPAGRQTSAKVTAKARELIQADPAKAQMFADLVNLSGPDAIPGVIAFWSEILRELQERAGGNAFDNTDTLYEGTDDDAKLNADIPRFESDPKAVEYVRQWVTVRGEPADPVLAFHTLVDDLIPPQWTEPYKLSVEMNGLDDHYALVYNTRVGHCNMTEAEMAHALNLLTEWIKSGKRPEPGDITRD